MLDGIKQLASAAKNLPEHLRDCKGAVDDYKQLFEALKQMEHPKEFAFHIGKDILVNGKDIYHHIQAMIQDFKEKNFKNFGKELGIILEEILVGNKPSMAVSADVKFL